MTHNSLVLFLLHQVSVDLGEEMTNDTPSFFSVTEMNQTPHQEAVEIELAYESAIVALSKVLSLTSEEILQTFLQASLITSF